MKCSLNNCFKGELGPFLVDFHRMLLFCSRLLLGLESDDHMSQLTLSDNDEYFTLDFGSNLIIFNFRTFMMPNLIPPKIPDGEKVDFDVREKEKEIKTPSASTGFVP